jgi:uncharacterized delta-60 repeat protein
MQRRRGFVFAITLIAWANGLRAQPGALDTNFNAAFTTGHWGLSVAVQPDGKVIAAGMFGVVRFLNDGSVDPGFQPIPPGPAPFGGPYASVALQPDGKVLVTGSFTNAGGMRLPGVMRLNADGSIDPSFKLDARVSPTERVLALQLDGKVVTGGFYDRGGDDVGNFVRLLSNGSLDPDWHAGWHNFGGDIYSVAIAPNGKIYFGTFDTLVGLNADGSSDDTFNPDPGLGPLGAVAVQPDGKVLIGGYGDGASYRQVRRLLASGADDPEWTRPAIDGGDAVVYAILLQPDGKVLVGGNNLQSFDGVPVASLGRLNPDGSTDATFDTGAELHYYSVEDMALAPDGRVVVAGNQLNRPDITAAPGIWRLNNDAGMQPQLSIGLTQEQGIVLGLRGQPGATYRLEYREQLTGAGPWTPLTNLTLSGAMATWQDTGWTNSTSRFYRAASVR